MNSPQIALRHQQLALRIAQLHSKEAQLEKQMAGSSELDEAKDEVIRLQSARQQVALKLRESERDASDRQQHLKTRQTELMSGRIRNSGELLKLDQEVEHLRGALNQVEDVELQLMGQLEEVDNQLANLEQRIVAETDKIKAAMPQLQAEQALIEQETLQLESERAQRWAELAPDWRHEYEKLKQRVNNPVAEVLGDQCQGCRVSVTSSGLQKLRRGELVTCDNCGRLLAM